MPPAVCHLLSAYKNEPGTREWCSQCSGARRSASNDIGCHHRLPLNLHMYTRREMKEPKKLNSAQVNTGCKRHAFSCCFFCNLLQLTIENCFHKASNYTMLGSNSTGANTEYIRTNRLVAPVTTSPSYPSLSLSVFLPFSHTHTPVFTRFLTEPSVLHVNRVCLCAEEVLTSSVLHLDQLLICIKRERVK